MTWVALDDKFHSNPKVTAAGNAGAGLYAKALSYCGDHLTDGYVPEAWARMHGSVGLRRKLVDVGLWEQEEDGYRIRDYLVQNPSREAVLEKRAKRAEAGKKGASKRWGDGNSHSTSYSTSHGSNYGKSIAKGQGLEIVRTASEIALSWLDGSGWDETFDQAAIIEEVSRVVRKAIPGSNQTIDNLAVIRRWKELRSQRYGVAA